VSSGLRRGEIYRVRHPQHGDPKKSRCFAVVSRQDLLDSKANRVLCAPINTSAIGLSTEVQVGVDERLKHESVINCDQITRLEKSMLTDYIGALSLPKLKQLRTALAVAFDIDDDPDADILDLT
jgi:mRNA interferase MazF